MAPSDIQYSSDWGLQYMKLFTRLFAGLFLFELARYGMAYAPQGDYPALSFLMFPAIWIAMAIGRVHSAGIFVPHRHRPSLPCSTRW